MQQLVDESQDTNAVVAVAGRGWRRAATSDRGYNSKFR
jgi:hypothetical protein